MFSPAVLFKQNVIWNRFLVNKFADGFKPLTFVKSNCFNIDLYQVIIHHEKMNAEPSQLIPQKLTAADIKFYFKWPTSVPRKIRFNRWLDLLYVGLLRSFYSTIGFYPMQLNLNSNSIQWRSKQYQTSQLVIISYGCNTVTWQSFSIWNLLFLLQTLPVSNTNCQHIM